jgi:hypothetical protein
MNSLHTPDQFKTRPARLIIGGAGLVLSYFLVTRAFDTGSMWQYLFAIIVLVLGIRLIWRAIKPNKNV